MAQRTTPHRTSSGPRSADKYQKKLRGHVQHELVHALAEDVETRAVLAARFGVSQSTITYFARKYADQIECTRADLENEFSDLWVSAKRNRIAEYQDDIERINEALTSIPMLVATVLQGLAEGADPDHEVTVAVKMTGSAIMLRTKSRLLRNVAEEMGQLPARNNIQVVQPQTVVYHVSGVDLSKLT